MTVDLHPSTLVNAAAAAPAQRHQAIEGFWIPRALRSSPVAMDRTRASRLADPGARADGGRLTD